VDIRITELGATTEPGFDNRTSIQSAVDRCAAAGGGRVIVPQGTFVSGEILLKSHVCLYLEPGAVLRASADPAAYPTRYRLFDLCAFISAVDAEYVTIAGEGTLDGDCHAWVDHEDAYYLYKRENDRRPFLVQFVHCRHVVLRDITIRNGPVWTVVPRGCDDVLISGVSIYNDLRMPNNDAIDIVSCRDVRIVGCHIEAADDCICLKTFLEPESYPDAACDGVTVTGCTLVSTSSALVIGCEVFAPIRNVIFTACVIRRSNRGLSINLSKSCDIENVIFSDMVIETRLFFEKWWGHGEAIKISAIPWLEEDEIGHVRNILIRNVIARSENGILVYGWRPGLIQNLTFENVDLTVDRWSKWPGGELDLRPTPQDGADYHKGVVKHPLSAFLIREAEDVILRNCRVTFTDAARATGEFHHAVGHDRAPGLHIEGLIGEAALPDLAAVAAVRILTPAEAENGAGAT